MKSISAILPAILNRITPKDSDMTTETENKTCIECCKEFPVEKGPKFLYWTRCGGCSIEVSKREDAKRKRMAAEQMESRWRLVCPKQFQMTELSRLPDQEAATKATEWQHGNRGLILNGPTGSGKSRTAWMVIKQCHFAGLHIECLNSMAGLKYASLFSGSASDVEQWVGKLINADLLFMDDIFKIKLTDSFESVIFSLVDQRTENGRPIILTANDTGESLTARMSPDRGEPLVRRLREFCDTITFQAPSHTP